MRQILRERGENRMRLAIMAILSSSIAGWLPIQLDEVHVLGVPKL